MAQGWATKFYFTKKWYDEATRPEYSEFLPKKPENAPKITISFDISILLDCEFDRELKFPIFSKWNLP